MGAWGMAAWDNDGAADWFGDLFAKTKLAARVEKTLRITDVEDYADVFEACLAVPACRSTTVFGFGDRYARDELGDATPLLFDVDYEAKPAFFAVQQVLSGGRRSLRD